MTEMKNINIKIDKRKVGNNYKPFIIAELGQSHGGKIKKIFRSIDLISKTGVDAIKFQTHIADQESTLDEPFRRNTNLKLNYKTRYDYWKSVEFSSVEWRKIKKYVEKKKLIFLTSVFSVKAVQMMKKIGVKTLKIGSGEFNSLDIIEEIIKSKLTIILSTGMSNQKEIDEMYRYLKRKKASFAFFQCTSNYPVKLKKVGINLIDEFKERYHCPIGLSDHSGTIYPSIFAMSLNSNLIEVHVKVSKNDNGPDSSSSIQIKDLKTICDINKAIYIMRNNPVNKSNIGTDLKKMRKIFGKSVALRHDLDKGNKILKENILMKKPAYGFSYKEINKLVGKRVKRFVSRKKILREGDIL